MIGRAAAAALIGAAALQGCASANSPTGELVEAVLINVDEPSVRESLRVVVRENGGGQARVEPDSLASSPVLRLTERPGLRGSDTALVGAPRPVFRLVMDDTGRCFLSRDGTDPAILAISDAARCRRA